MQKSAEMEAESAISLDELEGGAGADADESPAAVYEVAYHLLPTVPEEALTGEVKRIHDFLAAEGAAPVGDRFPALVKLAYSIEKRVSGKPARFDEAQFGWIAFELPRAAILRVKEWFDANPSILRFLIVKTSRDAVLSSLAGPVRATAPVTGKLEKPKREAEEGGEVSEAALDEALKTIESEAAKAAE